MSSKELGVLTFRRKDDTGHFVYKFKVSDYYAAKILEYIAQIPHEAMKVRAPYKKATHPNNVEGE